MSGPGSNAFGTMMTLAQLAALSPTPRPSGETVAQQAQRILTGINSTLLDPKLATAGLWQAVWVGLTQDRGNLCFIAVCPSQNAFAVSCRGTQFNSLVDLGEDLAVGTLAQFTPQDTALLVSQGSMEALTEAVNCIGVPSGTMFETLSLLLGAAPAGQPTLYVTGHSLGGAMATMLAVYLWAQNWTTTPAFAVYTFAAPSAGLASFADYYDTHLTNNPPNQTWRVYNAWDAVPYAWASLPTVQDSFYPTPTSDNPKNPGPAQTLTVKTLLSQVARMPGSNVYVQTNGNSPIGKNTKVLDTDYSVFDAANTSTTTEAFLGQVAYQHNCYLTLLSASELPAAGAQGGPPIVESISPNNGSAAGGALVTITGGVFTTDCVVDFGTVPAVVISISPGTITAIQPPGIGTVNVRVTNLYGTSAITSADQFAAPPPAAPTVSSVSPSAGPAVPSGGAPYHVTVTGTGFVTPSSVAYVVNFGAGNAGTDVTVVSLTKLTVTPPQAGSGTVDVEVTNARGTSVPVQFTFGTPIVTGVSPSSGPAKNSQPVTISGFGFVARCTVQFVGDAGPKAGIDPQVVNDTTMTVTPPNVLLPGGKNERFDVTVTNPSKQVSAITPADEYTYYQA